MYIYTQREHTYDGIYIAEKRNELRPHRREGQDVERCTFVIWSELKATLNENECLDVSLALAQLLLAYIHSPFRFQAVLYTYISMTCILYI